MGFSTLLIVNRGEIACRIARKLGYRTVGVPCVPGHDEVSQEGAVLDCRCQQDRLSADGQGGGGRRLRRVLEPAAQAAALAEA